LGGHKTRTLKWHILTLIFLLITSGQCMDSKEVKQKERRTLLDLILQVIRDSQQQRDKGISRRCNSGLFTAPQDMKFSSREKPFYVPRLDNSRLIGKLIRSIFRFLPFALFEVFHNKKHHSLP
uniref:Uncharacterized protein n=1 Tax=Neogobius melanostomus TaxID=47308 RepID=A0A8C6U1Y8_9GOBI